MSQPFDRSCAAPQPGALDDELGEFWVDDPWKIMQSHNLSCFERNLLFLNRNGEAFFNIGVVSGTDSDGDGRSVVAADFRNEGRMDLVVRQVGGGSILIYENRLPVRHYLKVTLRGQTSNRLGIGARLTAHVGERRIVRDMFPRNSYRSQMPNLVHFGLADSDRVDRLHIRWPSGSEQTLENLAADRHVVITEGRGDVELAIPGTVILP